MKFKVGDKAVIIDVSRISDYASHERFGLNQEVTIVKTFPNNLSDLYC